MKRGCVHSIHPGGTSTPINLFGWCWTWFLGYTAPAFSQDLRKLRPCPSRMLNMQRITSVYVVYRGLSGWRATHLGEEWLGKLEKVHRGSAKHLPKAKHSRTARMAEVEAATLFRSLDVSGATLLCWNKVGEFYSKHDTAKTCWMRLEECGRSLMGALHCQLIGSSQQEFYISWWVINID